MTSYEQAAKAGSVLKYWPENPAGSVFLCVGSTEETLVLFRADTFKLGDFLHEFKLTLEEKLNLESNKITWDQWTEVLGNLRLEMKKIFFILHIFEKIISLLCWQK
jgi:hypothetical protein